MRNASVNFYRKTDVPLALMDVSIHIHACSFVRNSHVILPFVIFQSVMNVMKATALLGISVCFGHNGTRSVLFVIRDELDVTFYLTGYGTKIIYIYVIRDCIFAEV